MLEDEKGNIVEKTITTNPQTGDNIGVWTATAIASLLLLIILSRKRKVVRSSARRNVPSKSRVAKVQTRSHSSRASQNVRNTRTTRTAGKHSKGKHCGKGFKFFAILLAIAIIFPTVSRAVSNSSLVVTFDTNFKFRDKLIVEYDANNGTKQKVIKYNELIGELEEPTKDGYEFDEWVLEDGTPLNPEEPITDDVKITAKLKAITYTISYDLKDGALEDGKTNPIEYTIESNNIQLNNPVKENYNFIGWTGSDLERVTEYVVIPTGSIGNREYTANWEAKEYTISYNLNGGTVAGTNPAKYTIESNDINLIKPTKANYDFQGWTGTDLEVETENVTIAKGSTGNREYTANWKPTEYTITYQGLTQEEEAALHNPTSYNIESPSITLDNPEDRTDEDGDKTQIFVGWRESSTSISITIPPIELGDKIYEAIWVDADPNTYTITYNLNGGTVSPDNRNSFTKFDTFTLNNPTKNGYTFKGWTGSNGTTPQTTVTIPTGTRESLSYTANFDANTYAIVFNNNTGVGTMDNEQMTYDVEKALTTNTFTKEGYHFAGWNSESNGTGASYTDGQTVKNIVTEQGAEYTVYAQWEPNQYSVIFNKNNDNAIGTMSNQVLTYDEAKALTANSYVYDHYKFMGWSATPNGNIVYQDAEEVENLSTGADVTLYAQWKERTAYLKGTVNNSWGSAGDMLRGLGVTTTATAFRHYEGEPNFDEIETKVNMAINSSNFPVYAWAAGETIYWWSEAETIYAHEDSRNFFGGFTKLESIDYSGFDFSLTKNLTGFFNNTKALNTVDLSPLGAANPTTLENMFQNSGITSVDLSPLNTSDVTIMKNMFNGANRITTVDLSVIDTSNVTDMSGLFMDCTNFESVDFSQNDLGSLEDMNNMFRSDRKLTNVDFTGVDTPNLKNMEWIFGGAKIASLDLSDIDTGNVTNFGEMFYSADIQELDISGWDTSSATTLGSMFTAFNGHGMVLDLSHFNTENVTRSMYEMFNGTNVSVIDLSSFNIDETRAENISMANLFYVTRSVETIYATENLHFNPNVNLSIPIDYAAQWKLVGGAGTTLHSLAGQNEERNIYARIDDPDNGKPGIFTLKNARYIRYNGNGADDKTGTEMTSHYLTSTTPGNLKTNTFAKNGYVFKGWNTKADGSGTAYTDGQLMEDIVESKTPLTLYAQWKPATYTIVFNKNGENDVEGSMSNMVMNYNQVENLTTNNYSRRYYRFIGWNTEPDGSGTNYSNGQEITNLTTDDETTINLYAQWEELISILQPAQAFADRIRTCNPNMKQIIPYNGTPNLEELDTINIAASGLPTYIWTDENDIIYYWSEAKSKINANMNQSFCNITTLEKIDFSGFSGSEVTNWSVAFTNCSRLKEVNFGKIDFSKTTTMASMFNGTAIESIDLSGVKTSSKLTNVGSMFNNCTKLKTVVIGTNFDTSNVSNFSYMFNGTTVLESLDEENLKVTDKATSVGSMFRRCALSEINVDSWDTSNITDMSYLFANTKCTELDLSNFNTSNVTNMSGMFSGCSLNTIDVSSFNTSDVTNMSFMFNSIKCNSLDISNFDTSNVTNYQDMFSNTSPLKTVYASESFNPKTYNMRTFEISGVKGGAGTTWAGSRMLAQYAQIDDPDNGKPGYFSIKGAQYIRYDGNGADNSEYETMTSHYLTNTGSLKANAFVRDGYTFAGWNTEADGSGTSYTDEQLMSDLVESKTPLTLYAQWE